jgi:hypothetical protein
MVTSTTTAAGFSGSPTGSASTSSSTGGVDHPAAGLGVSLACVAGVLMLAAL